MTVYLTNKTTGETFAKVADYVDVSRTGRGRALKSRVSTGR